MYLNRRYIGSFFSTFSIIPISTTPNFLHFALLSSNVSWEQEEEILIYRKKESKENNKGSTIPILQLSFRRKSTIYRAALNEARERNELYKRNFLEKKIAILLSTTTTTTTTQSRSAQSRRGSNTRYVSRCRRVDGKKKRAER